MPAEDNFTSTVDGAAGHAAQFAVYDDDGPSLSDCYDGQPSPSDYGYDAEEWEEFPDEIKAQIIQDADNEALHNTESGHCGCMGGTD